MGHQTFYLIPTIGLFIFIFIAMIDRAWLWSVITWTLGLPFLILMMVIISPLLVIQAITGIGEPFPWRDFFRFKPKSKKPGLFEDW